jgi:hypothetical protein
MVSLCRAGAEQYANVRDYFAAQKEEVSKTQHTPHKLSTHKCENPFQLELKRRARTKKQTDKYEPRIQEAAEVQRQAEAEYQVNTHTSSSSCVRETHESKS